MTEMKRHRFRAPRRPLVTPLERTPALPQTQSTWLFFALPTELMLHCLSFLSSVDTQRVRLLCRRTRELIDWDPLSPFWREHAHGFFACLFRVLSGIDQLGYLTTYLHLARMAKEVIIVTLDKTVQCRSLLHYSRLFTQHKVRYGFVVPSDADAARVKSIFAQSLPAESIEGSCEKGELFAYKLAKLRRCKHWKTFTVSVKHPEDFTRSESLERIAWTRAEDMSPLAEDLWWEDLVMYDALPPTLESLTIPTFMLTSLSVLNNGALRTLVLTTEDLDLDFSHLPVTLEALTLSTSIERVVLTHLVRLTTLDLSHNALLRSFDANDVPLSLRELSLQGTSVGRLVDIERLSLLEKLNCSETCLESLQGLETLTRLRHLNVTETDVGMANWQYLPSSLVTLNVRCTGMHLHCLTAALPAHLEMLDVSLFNEGIPCPRSGLQLPPRLRHVILSHSSWEMPVDIKTLCETKGMFVPIQALLAAPSLAIIELPIVDESHTEGLVFPEGLESLVMYTLASASFKLPPLPHRLHTIKFDDVFFDASTCALLPPNLKTLELRDSKLKTTADLVWLKALTSLTIRSCSEVVVNRLPPNLVHLDVSYGPEVNVSCAILPSTLSHLNISFYHIVWHPPLQRGPPRARLARNQITESPPIAVE